MPTKLLKVAIIAKYWGYSAIEIPKDMSLEDAIEYAKDHIDNIALPNDPCYITDSDEIDEENCKFIDWGI